MWEFTKIAGGGTIGVVIAILILWWAAGKDPFDLGPKIAQFAPWLVPPRFHGPAATHDVQSNTGTRSGERSAANPRSAGTATQSNRTDVTVLADANSSPFSGMQLENGSESLDSPLDKASTNGSGGSSTVDRASHAAESGVEARLRYAPQKSAEELRKVIEDYLSEAKKWLQSSASADDPESAANRTFYASLASLGDVLMYVDPKDVEVQTYAAKLENYLGNFGGSEDRFAFVADEADKWLTNPQQRTNNGVMLAGTVIELRRAGKLYHSQVQLASPETRVVPVVGLREPLPTYRPGARVLLLGVIVKNPLDNIFGYGGSADEVVCGAYVIPVPATEPKAQSRDSSLPQSSDTSPDVLIKPATDLLKESAEQPSTQVP